MARLSALEIVSIISVLGSLILLSQSGAVTRLGLSRKLVLGFVWAAIIVVLTVIIARIIEPGSSTI